MTIFNLHQSSEVIDAQQPMRKYNDIVSLIWSHSIHSCLWIIMLGYLQFISCSLLMLLKTALPSA